MDYEFGALPTKPRQVFDLLLWWRHVTSLVFRLVSLAPGLEPIAWGELEKKKFGFGLKARIVFAKLPQSFFFYIR